MSALILKISPRLLPGLYVAGAWLSLEPLERTDRAGKPSWRWHVDLADGNEHSGDDLHGWGNAGGMMVDFLDFLICTPRLFPAPVAAWALANSDELSTRVLP